ncbi:MAG: protocatechuate 4,5-dioxygenase subunit alpha [Pseudomonadota bacterium]
MALDRPYLNIPGTTIFDSTQARRGYHLNQFFYSLMKEANRQRFLSDESAYLDEWPITPEQKQAVLDRDYNRVIALGGNVYFFGKLFFTDEKSFEMGAAMMTGMKTEEYRAMMVSGGRSVEGNRFDGEED